MGKSFSTDDEKEVPSDFKYLLIALAILFISTRVIQAKASHIFAVLLGYLIISKLREKEVTETLNFNQNIDYRNELLSSPSHFHMDVNIINLFFSIFGWRNKNANNYDNAVKAVNNILRLEADTEGKLERCVDNYEVAFDQSKTALNLIHGFVYTLDHPLLIKKLKKVLARLQQLLQRHLENIRKNCQISEDIKDGRDTNSRFIEDAEGPKPFDGQKMSQFDYY